MFHDTFDSAATEAERLALKENKSVAVLQGVAICIPPDPAVTWEFADNVVVNEDEDEDEAEDPVKDFQDEKFKEILDLLFPRK